METSITSSCTDSRARAGHAPRRRRIDRYPGEPLLFSRDPQQLHVEDEGGAARDRRGMAVIAVGHVGRTDEARLLAHLHLLHAFGPALDHLVEAELGRLAALVRRVEDGAVAE